MKIIYLNCIYVLQLQGPGIVRHVLLGHSNIAELM